MTKMIAAEKIEVNSAARVIKAVHFMDKSTGCRVHAKLDDDGNVVEVGCVKDSCNGECELKTESHGDEIHYSCNCKKA